jgi:hypothetical protein
MLRSRLHPHTFEERLAERKARLEQRAHQLKPGAEREELLRKAEQIDTATHINEWLNSGPPSAEVRPLSWWPLSLAQRKRPQRGGRAEAEFRNAGRIPARF